MALTILNPASEEPIAELGLHALDGDRDVKNVYYPTG